MWLKENKRRSSIIRAIIYAFFVAECLSLGQSSPSECKILALLFFLGLVIIGLPILNNYPILKFFLLGVAIVATICYSLVAFFFFEHAVFIILSVVNAIAFVLLIILNDH